MSANKFEQKTTSMKLFLPMLLSSLAIAHTSFAMQKPNAEYHPDNYLKKVCKMDVAVKRVHRYFRYFPLEDLDKVETGFVGGKTFCTINSEDELYVPINVSQEQEFTVWFDKLALDQKELFVFGVEFIKLHKRNGIQ